MTFIYLTFKDILMSRKATVGISEFPFVSDLKKMAIGMID